jgi:hypothetical protein
MAKPKDANQLHLTLPNGRVPAGSVALPGIHSVAAARAALSSANGVSVNVGVNSTNVAPAGRAFNLRSNHPVTSAEIPASPQFQLPPYPDSGHPFYGLPPSFHKNKDRPSNLASTTATTSSSTTTTTSTASSAVSTKHGKSGSKHWLSCYHSTSSQTPTPSPSDKEEDSETPSPTDHGFKPILERPTTLLVRGLDGVLQSGGESTNKCSTSFFFNFLFLQSLPNR